MLGWKFIEDNIVWPNSNLKYHRGKSPCYSNEYRWQRDWSFRAFLKGHLLVYAVYVGWLAFA